LALPLARGAAAQQNPVTAIDIALEPDATMVQHAMAANARLLKSFPKGFALDETHHPHVTMLQQFVRTEDLEKVFAAVNAVLAKETSTAWTLKAFKYYYVPSPPVGLAGIVVEPTEDLHRLQDELIAAVKPYTVKTGTAAAFRGDLDRGVLDIQKAVDPRCFIGVTPVKRKPRLTQPRYRAHDAVRLEYSGPSVRPERGGHVAERLCFQESVSLEELRAGEPDPPGSCKGRKGFPFALREGTRVIIPQPVPQLLA